MNKILVLIIFLSLSINIFSQDIKSEKPFGAIEYMINEKLRFKSLEEIKEFQAEARKKYSEIDKVQNIENNLVSDDATAESEIHMAQNPTNPNNIVVSPIKFDLFDFLNSTTCPIYYTNDYGNTWQTSNFKTVPLVDNYAILGGGDPVFAYDANGILYMTWINLYGVIDGMNIDSVQAAMYWAYSADGGANWTFDGKTIGEAAKIDPITSEIESDFLDKQWMASDLTNSPYRNSIYTSVTHITNDGSAKMAVYRKRENSDQFEGPVFINLPEEPFIVQFSSIEVDTDGTLHLTFYINYSDVEGEVEEGLYHCYSTDGGVTFSSPNLVSELISRFNNFANIEILDGLNSERYYPCPHLSVDPTNDNLYMTWNSQENEVDNPNGLDVYFARSTNNGESWSTRVLNDDNENFKVHNFYPSIDISDDGVIALAWYDEREGQNQVNQYMTFSFDGGQTFTENINISEQAMQFSTMGQMNNGFGIGEYNEIIVDDEHAIAVWADGRLNNGDLDVYTAFVPLDQTSVVEKVNSVNSGLNINSVYPNPAQNEITTIINSSTNANLHVIVVDIEGNEVMNLNNVIIEGQNELILNVADLTKGTYFIKVTNGNSYSTRKFIVL